MNDVYVTIHPAGWVTLLVIAAIIYIAGYLHGNNKGWKRRNRLELKHRFDFDTTPPNTTSPKTVGSVRYDEHGVWKPEKDNQ